MPGLDEYVEALFEDEDEDDDEAYAEDEDEAYAEDDDDDDDEAYAEDVDDDDDDEAVGEDAELRRIFRRHRRRFGRGPRRTRFRRFRRPRRRRFNFRGKKRGVIRTPGGRGVISMGKAMATAAEVKAAVNRLSKDIAKNGSGISRLDKAVRKVDKTHRLAAKSQLAKLATFEKSIGKKLKKLESDKQSSALLPLLLQSTPELTSFTDAVGTTTTVTNSEFKSQDNTLLLLLAMGGGGLGSGGGLASNPLMLLLLTGALK